MTTANEDLKLKLQAIHGLPWGNKENQIWDATARNILDDDLGKFSDSLTWPYDLDDDKRDRLIAHTRQDAAMAYIAIVDTYKHAKAANKYAQWAVIFAFISMCISVYLAYKLF